MQLKIKSRRHLRNKRSNTTQTQTGMTQRQLRQSSKKLLMLTKFCQTLINEEFMINLVRKECNRMLNGKAQDKELARVTSTLILMTSSGVVGVVDTNTFISISSRR